MKNIILTTIALLSFTVSNAQIGQAKELENYELVGKLTNPYKQAQLDVIKRQEGPNKYRMTLQNMDYLEIVDMYTIFFNASEEDLRYLFDEMMKAFNLKKTDTGTMISLGDGRIRLTRAPGGIYMRYYEEFKTDKMHWFTKGQVRKLFALK